MFLVCHNFWATEILASAKKQKLISMSDTNPSVRLFKHTFSDGRVYEEFVQGQVNEKSGVLIFVAFKDEQGNVVKESLWKKNSMKPAVR